MIDQRLLEILVCPEDKTAVQLAQKECIDRINSAIRSGQLENRAGVKITEQIDGGLIRADKKYLYPIRDGIPVMLIDEAIELSEKIQ